MVDFFGDEFKVGDWILTPGYKGQTLRLLQISEIRPKKIVLVTEEGRPYGGIMVTEKCVIVPTDKILLHRLSK